MTQDTYKSLLLYSQTNGFRHKSIPDAVKALQDIALQNGWASLHTEDSSYFTPENLDKHAAVVFVMTSGDVFNEAQQAALQKYVEKGGGIVGVHSLTTTENNWPWFVALAGGRFVNHPRFQQGRVIINDSSHCAVPQNLGIKKEWIREDEFYSFDVNPRSHHVHVIMSADEESYIFSEKDKKMGKDHPLVWSHENMGGRVFQTALGHASESYADPIFIEHLTGGIKYALGVCP